MEELKITITEKTEQLQDYRVKVIKNKYFIRKLEEHIVKLQIVVFFSVLTSSATCGGIKAANGCHRIR